MFDLFPDFKIISKLNKYSKNTVSRTIGWTAIESNLPDSWLVSEGESVEIAFICLGETDHFDINPSKILEWRANKSLYHINPINCKSSILTSPNLNPIDKTGGSTIDMGIINSQNPQTGMVGISPRAQIQPICIGNEVIGNTENEFLKALDECIKIKPDIVFTNLYSKQFSGNIDLKIKTLYDMNIPFVCSAGSISEKNTNFPASSNYSICTGTFDPEDNLVNIKDNGLKPNTVTSTFIDNTYCSYESLSTSAAFITSILALVISKNKKMIKICGNSNFTTVPGMISFIQSSGFKNLKFGPKNDYHYGIIDIDKELENAKHKLEENKLEPVEEKTFKKEPKKVKTPWYKKLLTKINLFK